MSEKLHFKVSAGLKNIIGRELINDKFIAIFELVKNSYDAGAKEVVVEFKDIYGDSPSIVISDNGKGMSKESIINKWLFVAYSEKKSGSYRDNLKKRRNYAGAKGVGRFSCDRLGENIHLFSKSIEDENINMVTVDWNDFEKNDFQKFDSIDVEYRSLRNMKIKESGTIIEIYNLREKWDRQELLSLKKSLTQLVNPDSNDNYDRFDIRLEVIEEMEMDSILKKSEKEGENIYDKDIVNGLIKNRIFGTLQERTTSIRVCISPDGKKISTKINDGHVELFCLEEKNKYQLKNITGVLYNMTPQAKRNFTTNMGIELVNYGSVFVYKNGFRVYPYGEPGKDFFDIDRRKAQGYKRFFGTRDIIGRIDIHGENDGFKETSSRNGGFIRTYEASALEEFFREYLLKPLEKYCIDIGRWGETIIEDKDLEKNLLGFDTVEKFLKKIKPQYKEGNVINLQFDQKIIDILEKKKNTGASNELTALKKIVHESQNDTLIEHTEKIEKQTKKLEKRLEESQQQVDKAELTKEKVQKELEVTKKQVSVLESIVTLDKDKAVNTMHTMKTYADAIDASVDDILELLKKSSDIDQVVSIMYKIRQTCSKLMNSYDLVVNTDYSADTGTVRLDINKFIEDYANKQWNHQVKICVNPVNKEAYYEFNPLEFSIIIDNIIDNAIKGNAKKVCITTEILEPGSIQISFANDGFSLEDTIKGQDVFSKGITTTNGTGIGLNTVREYLDKIGGVIWVNEEYTSGFEVKVRLNNGSKL
ncbi:GHKL domain-containing protein [Listeria booriae]|uniref:ATP-binding protein n=1 Tax=Listeria booriae TaxID=1552123 RepID=UPI001627A80E|nr:ATP-binding protein [Listeria booriae]MBC1285908.1 GHKL domain-containing protein [Listeria booriae]